MTKPVYRRVLTRDSFPRANCAEKTIHRTADPSDEWDGVAGAANIVEMRTHKGIGRIDILKIRIEFDQKALSGSWR